MGIREARTDRFENVILLREFKPLKKILIHFNKTKSGENNTSMRLFSKGIKSSANITDGNIDMA